MSEKKRKRYPLDRLKLHDLLDKKENALAALQEEVEDLRRAVREADLTAIHTTAQMYNITPEQFAEIMKRMAEEKEEVLPALPPGVTSGAKASPEADFPEKEEYIIEDVDP